MAVYNRKHQLVKRVGQHRGKTIAMYVLPAHMISAVVGHTGSIMVWLLSCVMNRLQSLN